MKHTIMAMFSCLVLSSVSFGAPPAFSATWFNQLKFEGRLAFVTAALDARDADLQNFSFELTEDVRNIVKADKKVMDRAMWTRSTAVKRKGAKILLHDQEFDRDGKKKFEFFMSWDGMTYRRLNLPSEGQGLRGGIKDTEPTNFAALKYNTLLGLRAWKRPLTVAEWLKQSGEQGTIRGIDAVEKDGRTLIEIHVVPYGISNRRYWLDPARGYLPVRYDIRSEDEKYVYNWATYWVEEANEINGVWVPMRVVCHSTCRTCEAIGQYTFVVSRFELGGVTDAQLAITFPAGTEVVNHVDNTAFKITSEGGRQALPLYDPATGLVTTHGETVSEVFANAKTPFTSLGGPKWLLFGGASVLCVILGVLFLRGRKRLAA